MTEWAARRFWSDVTVETVDGGFGVHLDGRAVSAPSRRTLILPTRRLAEAVAAEWAAQEGRIAPETMPMTRYANTVLDRVGPQRADVVDIVAAYGGSDLLSYRADGPEGLVARQAEAWDPLLDWAAAALGARLVITAGVMPVDQPPEVLETLHHAVAAQDDFALAGLHDLVALSGSLVLGLAVIKGRLEPDEAWGLSRIDELWQIEQWGDDEEAAEASARKRNSFLDAADFFNAAQDLG